MKICPCCEEIYEDTFFYCYDCHSGLWKYEGNPMKEKLTFDALVEVLNERMAN